jgi:hypothetical protein
VDGVRSKERTCCAAHRALVHMKEVVKVAWLTVPAAQNGNTTRRYVMTGFAGMTVFDSIGAGPQVGNSAIRIVQHDALPGPSHLVGVEVIGAGAVQFRIRGGLQS